MLVSPDVWLSLMVRKRPEYQRDKRNLTIYGGLVGAAFILLVIRAFGFYSVSLRSSERLHDKMVVAVLHAPVFFFDSNPVGRILNRFSRDIGCMDEVLPKTFLQSVQLFPLLFTSILLPTITNPWVLFAVVPIAVSAGLLSRYYLKTSRELQRLESICRSPVYSHISETLDGLDTIRTRKREEDFVARFHRYLYLHRVSPFVLALGQTHSNSYPHRGTKERGGFYFPPQSFVICCSILKRFYLKWKAFDLFNKMRYILRVVVLLEACDVTNNGCHLGFYKN